ncbi:MAG: hypothetical protein COU68_00525, partial [Candidatus Pacebacteria bacterium CG10_big_fil_rev_8_21_14_0_10_45_6]
TTTGFSLRTADSAGTDRFAVLDNGNVGIGTTNPTGVLHVVGQCVTGDTLLKRRRRRRRKGKNGEWIEEDYWEDVRIDDIQEGDEILTLDEATGQFVPSKVNGLMDMGVQKVFELMTKSGKTIKTTANHPYLVKKQTNVAPLFAFVDETGIFDSGVYSQIGIGALLLKESEIELNQKLRNVLLEAVSKLNENEITFEFKFKYITPNSLPFYHKLLDKMQEYAKDWQFISILEKREEGRFWTQYLSLLERLIVPLQNKYIVLADHLNKPVKAVQSLSDFNGQGSIVRTLQLESQGTMLLQIADVLLGAMTYKGSDIYKQKIADRAKEIVITQQKRAGVDPIYAAPESSITNVMSLSSLRESEASLRGEGVWTKVSEIKVGQEIATINGYEVISSIKEIGNRQTYDIEVANTHNFVGNGIVAHNTYLQGTGTTTGFSLQTADSTGAVKFSVLDNGNVGIGTTNPGAYKLNVNGNTNITGNLVATGDVDASTGTITTLDGTTLTYTTGNLTTLDLGTNTITDGNFTGNWLATGYVG